MIKRAAKLESPNNAQHAQGIQARALSEQASDRARQLLTAIVEHSDDAIVTKDLNGIITSWNKGAQRLFGYSAEEVLGEPITILIPQDRIDEEPEILSRIRAGERVDHYETIRRRKDGSLVPISLTVSPLKDENGTVIGASKIARDISDRYRVQEQRQLLLKEMQHRVKNAFALASGLVGICARGAQTPSQVAEATQSRLEALAQAHALAVADLDEQPNVADQSPTLLSLLHALAAPYVRDDDTRRPILTGENISISPAALSSMAIVLNELVTNAAKHGALRKADGRISVACTRSNEQIVLSWAETWPGTRPQAAVQHSGFGTRLSQMTVEGQLGGTIRWEWSATGLIVTMTLDPAWVEG